MSEPTIDLASLPALVDVTSIAVDTTVDDVNFTCRVAIAYNAASAIVNPCWLSHVIACLREHPGILHGSTAAFPFGCEGTSTKLYAAQQVALLGADEIDTVMNVGAFLSGDTELVAREISLMTEAVDVPVKVIIEAALLNDGQIGEAASLAAGAGAHYVKSNTGLYGRPVTPDQIAIMKDAVRGRAKIKASGGIRTLDDLIALRQAGADRFGIGAKSALKIFQEIDERLGRPAARI